MDLDRARDFLRSKGLPRDIGTVKLLEEYRAWIPEDNSKESSLTAWIRTNKYKSVRDDIALASKRYLSAYMFFKCEMSVEEIAGRLECHRTSIIRALNKFASTYSDKKQIRYRANTEAKFPMDTFRAAMFVEAKFADKY